MTHERWIEKLTTKLPEGVPAEPYPPGGSWPQTFGDGEHPLHPQHKQAAVLQCYFCRHYVPLEGKLGSDWGACTNALSEYDGRCVFEHWTCKEFEVDT